VLNNFQNFQSVGILKTNITLERLNHLHARLRVLVKSTCSTYEPVLVLTFPLGLFCNQMFSLYYICIGVWDLEEMYSDARWDVALVSFYWAVLMTAHFYCMSNTCDETLEEVIQ
jgi:Ni/Fe-hydrogenase subunit HybB-like protein